MIPQFDLYTSIILGKSGLSESALLGLVDQRHHRLPSLELRIVVDILHLTLRR